MGADFSITGAALIVSLFAVILGIIGLIMILRNVFKKRSQSNLTEQHQEDASGGLVQGRNKYPEVDVFSLSGTFLNIGFLVAIGLMVLAFSWTQYEATIDVGQYLEDLEEEIEMEPPRTKEPPPPPPPPPPPVIEEVPEEEIDDEEVVEFEDQSIEEETIIDRPDPVAAPPPPPPPPPPEPEVEEIFRVVEEMPTFPGCENISGKAARKKCADTKMLQFIYKNIKYPPIARENGVEGMVVIRFVVEKNGSITAGEVVRDIGAQCGAEALRVVNQMPKWNSGRQRGRPVRVQFNLPVRFKLE